MSARFIAALLLLAGGGFSCKSPYEPNGTSCPATVCSNHGTCAYENTYPACTCAKGYVGQVCSACDTGYHRAPDDSCVADAVCTPGICTNGGMCSVVHGITTCSCLAGYSGPLCATCGAGFHQANGDGGMVCAPDQTCLPSTCSGSGSCYVDGGSVACNCTGTSSGQFCETPDASCMTSDPCTANGTCSDYGGVVTCNCNAGFAGPTCASCYPGYDPTDAGTCEIPPTCGASSCSFAGTCSVDAGLASCSCSAGYTGSDCSSCATGYYRGTGYNCLPNQTCAANQCGPNGTCSVTAGVAGCTCNPGWAGLACDSCYPGYDSTTVDGGTACLLETNCEPETCRFHGICSPADGGVSCACDAGYSGSFCETSVNACANNACGTGQCIDQGSGYICLCPMDGGVGQWGNLCP